MQTFDVLPRAIHQVPGHPNETSLAAKKSPHQSEQFGDVMDRTLNGASSGLLDDEAQQTANPDGQKNATHASGAHHGKPPGKLKKSHHPAVKPHEALPQNTPAQPLVVNACAAQFSQLAVVENSIEQKGNSENAPKETAETVKATAATGNSDSASETELRQLLTSAEAVGVPLPSAGPQNSAGTSGAKSKAAQPNAVVPLPVKAGAPDSVPNHPESIDLKHADGKAAETKIAAPKMPDAKNAGAKTPDAKTVAVKDSTRPGDSASAKSEDVSQELPATVSGDPPTQNAGSVDTTQISVAAPTDAKIAKMAGTSAPPGSSPVSPPDTGGTSAAKQYVTMQKAEKMQKVAGQTEQDLPGNPSLKGEELPMGQKSSVQALSHISAKMESPANADSQATPTLSGAAEANAPAATSITFSPAIATDTRMRMLERTHDIVALHAMRLAETGSNSLHVVVKPGAGVQLSLELRQNAGVVDVHASLHKGDFELLSQYWPELQQRLEARGVRVGALTTSENFTSTGHQSFQHSKQQQSSNQDSLHAGAFAEFALAGSMTEAPAKRAARATAYRGWETWA